MRKTVEMEQTRATHRIIQSETGTLGPAILLRKLCGEDKPLRILSEMLLPEHPSASVLVVSLQYDLAAALWLLSVGVADALSEEMANAAAACGHGTQERMRYRYDKG